MRNIDVDLARLARTHGVATGYDGPNGRVGVAPDTIVAVLGALGVDAGTPAAVRAALDEHADVLRHRLITADFVVWEPDTADVPAVAGLGAATRSWVETADGASRPACGTRPPVGLHTLHAAGGDRHASVPLLVPPARLELPDTLRDRRAWGLMTQLYAQRSRGSWGLGDLRDLADLASWSAARLGAGFVLVNPLHATEPVPPISPSPYLPTSRRFTSPLYLRVEDVPEYRALPPYDRRRIDELAGPLWARNTTGDLLDRDAVWRAKRVALEIIHRVPLGPERTAAYRDFTAREDPALTDFATWCALAERHGSDWRTWPAQLRDPRAPQVARARAELADTVELHAWLQWLCAEQLSAAQRVATGAGMSLGVLHDLAVGAQAGGADAWMYASVLASDATAGAPPDAFNQRGQDWAQPPWQPGRLAEAGYAPLRELIRYGLRHGGGLRVDHVMGLYRMWWIPRGASPADGTYVSYDARATVGTLTTEAAACGGVVIGEDLGTVEPEVRDDLARRGIFGTSLLWFERDDWGRPRDPADWRESCLATVDSHDLPPIAEYLSGAHIALRERLGLLTRDPAEEAADARAQLDAWRTTLRDLGLLAEDAGEWATVVALHGYLAATPARLIGVSLADAVGERRSQNVPGTNEAYPNWRLPLSDEDGTPLLLDDVLADPGVRELVEVVLGEW